MLQSHHRLNQHSKLVIEIIIIIIIISRLVRRVEKKNWVIKSKFAPHWVGRNGIFHSYVDQTPTLRVIVYK